MTGKFKSVIAAAFLALTMADALYLSQAGASTAQAATDTTAAGATVGAKAPDFKLTDTNGKSRSLADYNGKFVVLEWVNFECPFVKKHYSSGNMQALQQKYTKKGVVWLSINSSAPGKQGNFAPDKANQMIAERKAKMTAYLMDPDGTVGKSYGAKATPHMFVIDKTGTLVYAGAIDDNNSADPEDAKKAKNYVAAALDAAMDGKPVATASTKAYGCSVKYQQ